MVAWEKCRCSTNSYHRGKHHVDFYILALHFRTFAPLSRWLLYCISLTYTYFCFLKVQQLNIGTPTSLWLRRQRWVREEGEEVDTEPHTPRLQAHDQQAFGGKNCTPRRREPSSTPRTPQTSTPDQTRTTETSTPRRNEPSNPQTKQSQTGKIEATEREHSNETSEGERGLWGANT